MDCSSDGGPSSEVIRFAFCLPQQPVPLAQNDKRDRICHAARFGELSGRADARESGGGRQTTLNWRSMTGQCEGSEPARRGARGGMAMLKKFRDLSEREILALAISSEEEDGRIYGEFADALRESYPATSQMFEEMRAEEVVHRDRL